LSVPVLDVLLVIGGLTLVWLALADVFETVVVPGGSKASLRIARRLVFVLLPVWKRVRGRRKGLSSAFAPAVLVGSFVIWMAVLALGFAMLALAVRSSFQPALRSFGDALYLVGSSLVTVGLSETDATGGGRWVVVMAGFCGLAVMTMAVTYLLTVQTSIAQRDIGVLKLNTSAGEPPSALVLLERFAAIGNARFLVDVLNEGRNWCATVRQSHTSHPSLIYFRSVGTGAGWPAAVGALVDLALVCECWIEQDELYGPAVLLREDATKMARELAGLVGLKPSPAGAGAADLACLADRLRRVGYPVATSLEFDKLAATRAEQQGCIDALAAHLGMPTARLLP
jgi:hypothetical protein